MESFIFMRYVDMRTKPLYMQGDIAGYSDVVIPETYNGRTIASIANNGFENITTLKSITIPNTITIIPDYAFNGCTNLQSCTMSNEITSIGAYAFNGCSNLLSCEIPETCTEIKTYAFNQCTSLSLFIETKNLKFIGASALSKINTLMWNSDVSTKWSLSKVATGYYYASASDGGSYYNFPSKGATVKAYSNITLNSSNTQNYLVDGNSAAIKIIYSDRVYYLRNSYYRSFDWTLVE